MAFSENAIRILKERYLTRDKNGNVVETVDEQKRHRSPTEDEQNTNRKGTEAKGEREGERE